MGGSPAKRLHYHVNGSGRDTYIYNNHGGFMTNYGFKKDYDHYVDNLRGYGGAAHGQSSMKDIQFRSTKQ